MAASVGIFVMLTLALLFVPIHVTQFGRQFDRFVHFWSFQVANVFYCVKAFDQR